MGWDGVLRAYSIIKMQYVYVKQMPYLIFCRIPPSLNVHLINLRFTQGRKRSENMDMYRQLSEKYSMYTHTPLPRNAGVTGASNCRCWRKLSKWRDQTWHLHPLFHPGYGGEGGCFGMVLVFGDGGEAHRKLCVQSCKANVWVN